MRILLTVLLLSLPACMIFAQVADRWHWEQLPPIPEKLGVAGPFAGVHQDTLLVAGGANFPGKMPWEWGTKVWYDTVYALEHPSGRWKRAGTLPRALGYGVSLSTKQGVVCLGGSDSQQHYADCFLLAWESGQVVIRPLPALPLPCANFCGAMIGSTIYVAGGIQSPTATAAMKSFWSLDLENPQGAWEEREPWPGPPRMLAVAAVLDGMFYLASGTDLTAAPDGKPVREYLRDAYVYHPQRGWDRLPDMPRAAVAAPTPAPIFGPTTLLILGGDDGQSTKVDPPTAHPGFPKSILAFDSQTKQWSTLADAPVSHVTTASVVWNDRVIIPSGEIRPGVRSPAVWSFKDATASGR